MTQVLSLTKGQRLNLTKDAGLDFVIIGLGWSQKRFDTQADFDLDASAFVCDASGNALTTPPHSGGWMLYYNQLNLCDGALEHSGDERTGASAGDDETIKIDFTKLPSNAAKIAIIVTIHDAVVRKQNFGMIDEAHARVYDKTGLAVAQYNLESDASSGTALVFVEFNKNGSGEWVMRAIGEGSSKGLAQLCADYRVPGF